MSGSFLQTSALDVNAKRAGCRDESRGPGRRIYRNTSAFPLSLRAGFDFAGQQYRSARFARRRGAHPLRQVGHVGLEEGATDEAFRIDDDRKALSRRELAGRGVVG